VKAQEEAYSQAGTGCQLPDVVVETLDAWIAQQTSPLTRPEAIRAMMETILHILSNI
jgi:hypothetical protein